MALMAAYAPVDAVMSAVGLTADKWKQRSALCFFVNLAVNSMNGSPKAAKLIGLLSNKEVSQQYPLLVTPAGYAFAIWAPIFVGEAVFSIWQLRQGDAAVKGDEELEAVAPIWQLVNIQQTLWAFAFGHRYTGAAAVLLTGIAYSLSVVHDMTVKENMDPEVVTKTPFAMHFSWTVAAALINWNVFLKQIEAPKVVRDAVAVASLVTAGVVGMRTALVRCDATIATVTAWALYAISAKDKDLAAIGTTLSLDNVATFNTGAKVLATACLGVAAFVPFLRTWLN